MAQLQPHHNQAPHREYLFPLWLRIWHWTNATLILTLAVTGMSLHFAATDLQMVEFSLAVRIHDIAGVTLIAAYVFFVIANIVSGNWWQFVPKPPGILKKIIAQAMWYGIGIFRGDPEPHTPSKKTNFNALQALTYWNVMYMLVPVVVLSGLAYLFPQMAPEKVFGFDGLLLVAIVHYLAAVALILFVLSHIYLVTIGKTVWSSVKTMITGWHEH